MDYNLRAGDGRNSSFAYSSSEGYFASQALRVGLLGGAGMHGLPPPSASREAIEREIQKERIREELLAREMAERRILEEEVRREIEVERIMELRRFQMERRPVTSGSGEQVIHGFGPTRCFMSSSLSEARSGASLGREFVQDTAEVAFRERSPSHVLQKKRVPPVGKPSLPPKSGSPSASKKVNCNLSGAKRKVPVEFLQHTKQWVCAICGVSSPSEKGLKSHLQGKKHKANEAVLEGSKKTATRSTGKVQPKKKVTFQFNGASQSESMKNKLLQGKKQQKMWCGLCKVMCNSPIMMEDHLSGKKHKAFLELKKTNGSFQTEAVQKESNESYETI